MFFSCKLFEMELFEDWGWGLWEMMELDLLYQWVNDLSAKTDRYLLTITIQRWYSFLSPRYTVLDWFENSFYPGPLWCFAVQWENCTPLLNNQVLLSPKWEYWQSTNSLVILFTVLQELPEWESLQDPKVLLLRRWRRETPGLMTSPSQTVTWRTVSLSSPERTSPRGHQVNVGHQLGQISFTVITSTMIASPILLGHFRKWVATAACAV